MMTINKPLISVIMNCHNGENFIHRSISSVLNQTYKNLELIFFDNMSNDNSKKIFFEFDDDRLKYCLSNKFLNLGSARVQAVNMAQGDLIAFLDVDDIWHNRKLEKQVKFFNNSEVVFCCTSYKLLSRKKVKKYFVKNQDVRNTHNLIKNYKVAQSSIIVRRDAYNLVGGFDPRYSLICDFDLIFKLSRVGFGLACEDMLTYIQKHDKNASDKQKYLHIEELNLWKGLNFKYLNIKTKTCLKKNIAYKRLISLFEDKKHIKFKQIKEAGFYKIFKFLLIVLKKQY